MINSKNEKKMFTKPVLLRCELHTDEEICLSRPSIIGGLTGTSWTTHYQDSESIVITNTEGDGCFDFMDTDQPYATNLIPWDTFADTYDFLDWVTHHRDLCKVCES